MIDPLLDKFCKEVGVNPLAHAEYTLATGRADAVFNRLVIEYERPGVLKRTPDAATRHAIQQVNGRWREETHIEVNLRSLERLLTWLAGLSSGIALTSENLNRDFAIERLRTQNILRGLFQTLGLALEPSAPVGEMPDEL